MICWGFGEDFRSILGFILEHVCTSSPHKLHRFSYCFLVLVSELGCILEALSYWDVSLFINVFSQRIFLQLFFFALCFGSSIPVRGRGRAKRGRRPHDMVRHTLVSSSLVCVCFLSSLWNLMLDTAWFHRNSHGFHSCDCLWEYLSTLWQALLFWVRFPFTC